jgi:hypothetical protein
VGIVLASFLWHHLAMMEDTNTPAEMEDALADAVGYALQQQRYAKPRAHDCSANDAYYRRIAEAVVAQIKLSGWTLEPPQTLRRKPPLEHHSTPPGRGREEE